MYGGEKAKQHLWQQKAKKSDGINDIAKMAGGQLTCGNPIS